MGRWVAVVFVCLVLVGCGGGGSDDPVAGAEMVDRPGEPVGAVDYDEACAIALAVEDGAGIRPVVSGDCVRPGDHRFHITVGEGAFAPRRVFLSDGGGRQVEALPGADGVYVCDFRIGSENLLNPLLVQVTHDGGKASKAKVVVRCADGPGVTDLVRDGMGLLASAGLLDALKTPLGNALVGQGLEELRPASAAARDKGAALYTKLPFDVGGVPLTIKTSLGLDDTLENAGAGDEVAPKLKIGLVDTNVDLSLFDLPLPGFLVDALVNLGGEPMDIVPGGLLSSLGGGLGSDDGEPVDPDNPGLMDLVFGQIGESLEARDTALFMLLRSISASTTDQYAALGAGLYAQDDVALVPDPLTGELKGIFPAGVNLWDPALYPGLDLDPGDMTGFLALDVAQEGLNHLLGALLGNLTLDLPAEKLPIPLLIPEKVPGDVRQIVRVSFNRQGIAVDFRFAAKRMSVCDLRLTYLENDTRRWTLSLDLELLVDLGSRLAPVGEDEHHFLDISAAVIPELCHTHVMRDHEYGAGIFDHSAFAVALFETLTSMLADGATGGPLLSIDTDASLGFGLRVIRNEVINREAGGGRCLLELFTENEEALGEALGGMCFARAARL